MVNDVWDLDWTFCYLKDKSAFFVPAGRLSGSYWSGYGFFCLPYSILFVIAASNIGPQTPLDLGRCDAYGLGELGMKVNSKNRFSRFFLSVVSFDQVMIISIISVSSDLSEDSVGTPAERVILFGTIPTTIPDTTQVITPPITQTDTTVIPIIAPNIPPSPDYTPVIAVSSRNIICSKTKYSKPQTNPLKSSKVFCREN
ncbi:hypothetical protein Tco_0322964 [Tanacetum coccineum]